MNLQKIATIFTVFGFAMIAHTAFAATNDYTNYWAFDDAMGQSVGDTGGQNGIMTGSSTGFGWTSGKVGTALALDGLTGEGVALPDGFLTGGQGTISVWFKINELSSQNIIFSGKSTTDNNVYALLSIDSDGRPQFQYRANSGANDQKAQGTKILNKNEWYNLIFTANGQTYKMYINGEELFVAGANNGRWFPEITNQTLSYRIGKSEASPLSGSWNGILDELRIYNRAITRDEVLALYQEGNVGIPAVPIAIRPVATLSVSSDHILFGGSATLNWTATKVKSCTASGSWSGNVDLSGTQTFTALGSNATYTLTCIGEGGSVSKTVQVYVGGEQAKVASSTLPAVGTLTFIDITPRNPAQSSDATLATPFSHNLSVGVRSEDVKRLQLLLIQQGFLADGLSTGYFGQFTKSAVVKFQTKYGLPTTGYFGPMTRAKINTIK